MSSRPLSPVTVETGVLQGIGQKQHGNRPGEIGICGDDRGLPASGSDRGVHQDGGEGEEGEESCVAGADPGRSAANECVSGRPGEEEGEERKRGDLEERGGSGPGWLEEGAVEAGEEALGPYRVVPDQCAPEAPRP